MRAWKIWKWSDDKDDCGVSGPDTSPTGSLDTKLLGMDWVRASTVQVAAIEELVTALRTRAEESPRIHTTARQGWLDAADFVASAATPDPAPEEEEA